MCGYSNTNLYNCVTVDVSRRVSYTPWQDASAGEIAMLVVSAPGGGLPAGLRCVCLLVLILTLSVGLNMVMGCAQPASVWAQPSAGATRAIRDMSGRLVQVPAEPRRVATIDDGLIEGVMTHLGVIDRVAAIGSWGLKRDYRYEFIAGDGQAYEHRGWNTMKFLHPRLDTLPCVTAPQGYAVSIESLAKADPDLVIIRIGDCTLNGARQEASQKVVDAIEALGIPLVVLRAPEAARAGQPHALQSLAREITLIGEIFGQREQATALAASLARTERLIRERTKDMPDAGKPRLLYLGLNPMVRQQGGAGNVYGVETAESFIMEDVVNAKNAYTGRGSGVPVSAEQIHALDPDVIVLPTFNGYHPPRELYEAPYYKSLHELRAVKAKRVYAMPWTPMNCARRLEYPIDMLVMAKAAYPERFADISVYDFALGLYKQLYHVDDAQARGLAQTQILGWMCERGF